MVPPNTAKPSQLHRSVSYTHLDVYKRQAQEQYAFCPDVVDQGGEDATVGALADTLRQSDKWYFWWD